jgi:hypothetical protein
MLLYLAEDVGYALLGSVASIFAEVAGKVYAVWAVYKTEQVKRILRLQLAGGHGDEVGDEELTEEYWEDIRAMMALRWTNEIVCEKCCIVVGAFVTKVLIDSPRTTEEQIVIMLVFLATEFVADVLLVYCLDRWFAVPFRRMPLASELKSPEFWEGVKLTASVLCVGSFIFKHAFDTAFEWFPGAVDAVASGALGGNATSIALNAPFFS